MIITERTLLPDGTTWVVTRQWDEEKKVWVVLKDEVVQHAPDLTAP